LFTLWLFNTWLALQHMQRPRLIVAPISGEAWLNPGPKNWGRYFED
jgi:hypothetical protein